ncbi:MAG TPA: fibronectin type III domain-containing protein [Baekduia sp.]|nr:fibronectin type III domain-containing protein [Baekduia sp.]
MSIRSHLALITAAATLVCALVVVSVALAAESPLADTGTAKDVGQTQATLTATVTPRGSATSVRFDLGTTTSYGLQSASKEIGSGTDPVPVEIPVQGLTANTTYHFRVVATSEGGTAHGADATLKTGAVPTVPSRPAVTTGGVRDVGTTAATLTASINPHGASTSYRFEYGLTTSYGSSTPTADAGAGTRGIGVRARIGGLTAGKRYHYRIVATNSHGTTRGNDRSFVVATTATSATLSADRDPVPYGTAVNLSGKLGGSKVSDVRVRLQTTPFPFSAPFADTGNALRSSSAGAYSFSLPAVTTTLRALVVVDGLPSFFSKPIVIRSAARAGITSVTRRAGGRVVIRGRVIPATANGIAAVQRQSAKGTWLPLRRAHVGSDGRYSVALRSRSRAMLVRTVGLAHDGGAHVRGYSRTVKIAARRR